MQILDGPFSLSVTNFLSGPQRWKDMTPQAKYGHVLISSYACHPVEGSEPGVGWNILRAALLISERVSLVTRTNNVSEVIEALPADDAGRCTVYAHDLSLRFQRIKSRVPFGIQAYYTLWQLTLRKHLKVIHLHSPIDIAHHATFATDWTPSAVAALPDSVVKVWGPVGGATRCPIALWPHMGRAGILAEIARLLTGYFGRFFFGRHVARRSSLVIAQNQDDLRAFGKVAKRITVEPNAFLTPDLTKSAGSAIVDPFLIVGVGRLVGWKGWAIAILVMTRLPSDYRLEIYGEGNDRRRLEKMARRLGVEERVSLKGWHSREATLRAIASSRCLLHPSLHDSAPGPVAEAVSLGRPVVCFDLGGSGEISRRSGYNPIRVRAKRQRYLDDLCTSITDLAATVNQDRWLSDRLPGLLEQWYESDRQNGDDKQ